MKVIVEIHIWLPYSLAPKVPLVEVPLVEVPVYFVWIPMIVPHCVGNNYIFGVFIFLITLPHLTIILSLLLGMPALDADPSRQKFNHPRHHMAMTTLLKNTPCSYMTGATGHFMLVHF